MILTNVTRLSNISIFVGKGSIGSLFVFFIYFSSYEVCTKKFIFNLAQV